MSAIRTTTPFSSRQIANAKLLDSDFPQTARVALIHLLHHLVEVDAVDDWRVLARELQRNGRVEPKQYADTTEGILTARDDSLALVKSLRWEKVLDFVERLYAKIVRERRYRNEDDIWVVEIPLKEFQQIVQSEVQTIFQEEGLGFTFLDGIVERRGRKHTVDTISRATSVLGDRRLDDARTHYRKAIQFFRNPSSPDYENAVKEAVCAVEAAGKSMFPEAKASTLGDLIKWLTASEIGLAKSLAQTLTGLYAFRSGAQGVGHGGASGGTVTSISAEYVLAVAASQIIYLNDLADSQSEVPF